MLNLKMSPGYSWYPGKAINISQSLVEVNDLEGLRAQRGRVVSEHSQVELRHAQKDVMLEPEVKLRTFSHHRND